MIVSVDSYNWYALDRYNKAVNGWMLGDGGFPVQSQYLFDKRYGYVRYELNVDGSIRSARWAKTKRELSSDN